MAQVSHTCCHLASETWINISLLQCLSAWAGSQLGRRARALAVMSLFLLLFLMPGLGLGWRCADLCKQIVKSVDITMIKLWEERAQTSIFCEIMTNVFVGVGKKNAVNRK